LKLRDEVKLFQGRYELYMKGWSISFTLLQEFLLSVCSQNLETQIHARCRTEK
jgi:hypothetical protein